MALPEAYLVSTKNLNAILDKIQSAGVPDKFNAEFLKSLGFSSSNDRLILGVFKALGILSSNGAPTEQYRAFRDRARSQRVLASLIREAYSDLFLANESAQAMPPADLKGFFARKTGKNENIAQNMARTFRALCAAADFSAPEPAAVLPVEPKENGEVVTKPAASVFPDKAPQFHYNVQIHLPATKDVSVYNAIFKAVREHLMG